MKLVEGTEKNGNTQDEDENANDKDDNVNDKDNYEDLNNDEKFYENDTESLEDVAKEVARILHVEAMELDEGTENLRINQNEKDESLEVEESYSSPSEEEEEEEIILYFDKEPCDRCPRCGGVIGARNRISINLHT